MLLGFFGKRHKLNVRMPGGCDLRGSDQFSGSKQGGRT